MNTQHEQAADFGIPGTGSEHHISLMFLFSFNLSIWFNVIFTSCLSDLLSPLAAILRREFTKSTMWTLLVSSRWKISSPILQGGKYTVNQQILAAIKFGVSQNKVIWRLLNLSSPAARLCSVRSTYMLVATNISENTQFAKFAKYNSMPKFVDLQYIDKFIASFFKLDQRTMHPQVWPDRVQTHDLWIMTEHFMSLRCFRPHTISDVPSTSLLSLHLWPYCISISAQNPSPWPSVPQFRPIIQQKSPSPQLFDLLITSPMIPGKLPAY